MSNAIEQYINKVRKELYHLVPSEDYISDLRTILAEYIQQFPESTYQNLVEQFGSPEDVAAEYINSQKPNVPNWLGTE